MRQHTSFRRPRRTTCVRQQRQIISAGEQDRALYLLTEGTLGVRLDADTSKTFKAIDAPSVVGEVAFLDGGPRSATCTALTEVKLGVLSREAFMGLIETQPAAASRLALALSKGLADRLRLQLLTSAGEPNRKRSAISSSKPRSK